MNISDFKMELGLRLKEIREKTGYNQEDFYAHYLSNYSNRKLKKGTSIQDYMKRLENGYDDCPTSYLPIYASIAEIKLTELLDFSIDTEALIRSKDYTYPECANLIEALMGKGTISIEKNTDDTNNQYYSFRIHDEILNYILTGIKSLKSMWLDGIISRKAFEQLQDTFLSNFNNRVLESNDDWAHYCAAKDMLAGDIIAGYQDTVNPSWFPKAE